MTDEPGVTHKINAALYDEQTAKAADAIPANPLQQIAHPINTNKAVWAADKAAFGSVMQKLGLKKKEGGRGV